MGDKIRNLETTAAYISATTMEDPSKQQPPPYPGTAPYPAQQGYGAPPYPTQGQGVPPYPTQAPPPSGYQPPQNFGYTTQGNSGYGNMGSGLAGGYDSDAEAGLANQMGGGFGEKAIRRAFIRKVYGILCVQLMVTGAIITPFMYHQPLRDYVRRSNTIYWISMVITLVCIIAMACCEGVRRKFPTNIIFLGIFTAAEGFMLGSLAARFEAEAVLIAVGITCGVTLGLTLFAFQTKIDFTACGGMLCALLMILFVAGIIISFMGVSKIAMIGYGSAGALIFSLYIVYDTQLMMGGKHKYSLDPEEYIFASLNLYLDIINLFMYILMIVGASSSD